MKGRLLRNSRDQAIRIPKVLELQGVNEVELRKEGNFIIKNKHKHKNRGTSKNQEQGDIQKLNSS